MDTVLFSPAVSATPKADSPSFWEELAGSLDWKAMRGYGFVCLMVVLIGGWLFFGGGSQKASQAPAPKPTLTAHEHDVLKKLEIEGTLRLDAKNYRAYVDPVLWEAMNI
jgi:hypothetical protein